MVKRRLSIIILILFLSLSFSLLGTSSAYGNTDTTTSTPSADATSSTTVDLIPKFDRTTGLYGYVNQSGTWIIQPQFSWVSPFSEGLAAVAENREYMPKWGYIKPDGTYAIAPKFDGAYSFRNGIAVVKDNLFAATINKQGEYLKKTEYYLAGVDNDENFRAYLTNFNTAVEVTNVKYGVITKEGAIVKPEFDGQPSGLGGFIYAYKEDASKDLSKRTYAVILQNGTVIPVDGPLRNVSEGMGLIEYQGKEGDLAGRKLVAFITPQGEIYKSYRRTNGQEHPFLDAEPFSEGFAAVMISNMNNNDPGNYRWGFMRKDGTWLAIPEFIKVGSFKDGIAPVKLPLSNYGYVRTDMSWFIEPMGTQEATKVEDEYVAKESKEILKKLINSNMSDYDKLRAIYQYVTKTVKYDYSLYDRIPRVSYSAYGALKYGLAVCNGYALLMDVMLEQAGVESQVVIGYVSGVPHAWNLVKIGGNYYHIDATFDAGSTSMNYFLKSDEYMGKNRTWERGNYPEAPRNY